MLYLFYLYRIFTNIFEDTLRVKDLQFLYLIVEYKTYKSKYRLIQFLKKNSKLLLN